MLDGRNYKDGHGCRTVHVKLEGSDQPEVAENHSLLVLSYQLSTADPLTPHQHGYQLSTADPLTPHQHGYQLSTADPLTPHQHGYK